MSLMLEPGLDRHEWETQWQALEPLVEQSPAEALPELDDLVERMLTARGYALDDEVARAGDEREIVSEFLAARELTRLSERGESSLGDVAAAVNGYRGVYETLIETRSAP